jgi:hypothetical protein
MTDELDIPETVFQRSDMKWHYWDSKSSRWSAAYDTEDEARDAEGKSLRAAA